MGSKCDLILFRFFKNHLDKQNARRYLRPVSFPSTFVPTNPNVQNIQRCSTLTHMSKQNQFNTNE